MFSRSIGTGKNQFMLLSKLRLNPFQNMCEYVKDFEDNGLYKLDVDLPVTGDEKPAITTTTTTIAHSTALTKPVQIRKGVQKTS
jgi:hypothetical protein